ncbi:MAG: GNAT family N-acetyltransferase [Promethearchaeota archaeon]|nr:MAG: GNAT family N-acetyltransferase [Candidatus Lokiarchaeota archaeon]
MEFRKLSHHDIPQIQEISKDIWEGDDYIPDVIDIWLNDSDGYAFGLFHESNPNGNQKFSEPELIAFGRVKFLNLQRAWLEGGRVKASYQKQGLGTKLTEYAINYAIQKGVDWIQYSTYSENVGSISLAYQFGFLQKEYLVYLVGEISTISDSLVISDIQDAHETPEQDLDSLIPLSIMDIFAFIQNNFSPPLSDVNLGWTFVPIENDLFRENAGDFDWYAFKHAFLRVETPNGASAHESPKNDEVFCTLYGSNPDAHQLLGKFLLKCKREGKIQKIIMFLQKDLVPALLESGFHFEAAHETGILLFEKKV